jgi:hypothetical protein
MVLAQIWHTICQRKGAIVTCKFCGCTERRACLLIGVQVSPEIAPYILPPETIAVIPAGAETHMLPCQWLLQDPGGAGYVCSNPACVEKAYREARPLAEELAGLAEAYSADFSFFDSDPVEVFP